MSIEDAADRLGIAPEFIAAWTSNGAIASIPDEAGHLMVPRDAIEKRRKIARELAGFQIEGGEDVLVREQRLAS
jgi:predicted site-specific integrase-resolvase